MASCLRILHWNADGLTATKTGLLRHLLAEQKIDVALISETHLKAGDRLKTPGYHAYRKEETSPLGNAYRGLAILVRRGLVHQPLPLLTTLRSSYALGVEICVNGHPTRVFAFYKPPSSRLAVADVHELLDSPLPTIVAGDFNCKHTAWNSSKICLDGRRLFEDAEAQGYEVLGPEVPTHYPHNAAHAPDVIDLMVVRGLTTWPAHDVLDHHLLSDHQPVMATLDVAPTRTAARPPRHRQDWKRFAAYMTEQTRRPSPCPVRRKSTASPSCSAHVSPTPSRTLASSQASLLGAHASRFHQTYSASSRGRGNCAATSNAPDARPRSPS